MYVAKDYAEFLNRFGTHFVFDVTLGIINILHFLLFTLTRPFPTFTFTPTLAHLKSCIPLPAFYHYPPLVRSVLPLPHTSCPRSLFLPSSLHSFPDPI